MQSTHTFPGQSGHLILQSDVPSPRYCQTTSNLSSGYSACNSVMAESSHFGCYIHVCDVNQRRRQGKYQACTHGRFHVKRYIGHRDFRESLKACSELEMSTLYMLSDVAKGVAQVHSFPHPFFIDTRCGPRARRDEFVERRLQVPSFCRAWYDVDSTALD